MSCGPFVMALLMNIPSVVAVQLADREVAARAETEFAEGIRLCQASEQARPHFRQAAVYFDELRRRGIGNAELYRNLGNAYLLADDLPHAILSYRRGLRLTPNNRALRDSLTEARALVVYPVSGGLGRPRSDLRPPWLPHPPSGWLMIAGGVCYTLACMCLTRWRMMRRGRWLATGFVLLLLAGALTSWIAVRAAEQRAEKEYPLVVISRDGVVLRRGNSLVFPPRYQTPLSRGVEARRLFERDGWVQIELSGGEVGWTPRENVLVDAP